MSYLISKLIYLNYDEFTNYILINKTKGKFKTVFVLNNEKLKRVFVELNCILLFLFKIIISKGVTMNKNFPKIQGILLTKMQLS